MVSKGHDVPGVTLVAVLLADLSLNVPDFRAAERTFQLLVQVAGRAGRGDAAGARRRPDLPPEPSEPGRRGRAHDYAGFMAAELERRRALGYPPFARLVNLRLDGREARVGRARGARARRAACGAERGRSASARSAVLGPAPPPLERVRGRYRWQVLLRGAAVRRAARARARRAPQRRGAWRDARVAARN